MPRQQYKLNIDAELYARTVTSAKANNRSINAEICFQLQLVYGNAEGVRLIGELVKSFGADQHQVQLDHMDRMAGNS